MSDAPIVTYTLFKSIVGILSGRLPEGIHGAPAVFLSRHYLELALKYVLYHSRWLRSETINATDDEIEAVGKTHKLRPLWERLLSELERRVPSIVGDGLDLASWASL